MNKLFFWNTWRPTEQLLYFLVLGLFLSAVGWYSYAWFTGSNDVIQTVVESKIYNEQVTLDNIHYQGFKIPMDASMYYLTHYFRGGNITINLTANTLYSFFLAVSFVILLTVSTFLSRTWYIVFTALFVLYLVNINFELLNIWGKSDKTFLVICLGSYLPISYILQSFENQISIFFRFLIFTVITSLLGFLVFQFAEVENPTMFFNGFGLIIPLLLVMLFIAINSFEIVHGIFYLVTEASNESSRNTTLHFIIITIIYLLNLVYVFMYNMQSWDWGILYFSPFFLVLLTLILGIWGFKKREVLYQDIAQFAPHGALFYLAMSILTIATCAYAFGTANDALIEVFEDVITFTHLGFGIGFTAFVLVNFYNYIDQNKKAHRVVYLPHRTGFRAVFVVAIFIIGGLVFRTYYSTYRQVKTAYYNALGDLYKVEKDTLLMQKYYQSALASEYRNHKANYSMASLRLDQKSDIDALIFFEKALLKHPTEQSYLTVAQLHDKNEEFFKSIDKLREGLQKYPKSGKLAGNLALLYNRLNLPDSAFIYFDLARRNVTDANEKQIIEGNFYQFWLKDKSEMPTDSILDFMNPSEDIRKLNNELVYRTKKGNISNQPLAFDLLPDSVLETIDLTYFYNYGLNQAPKGDTSLLKYYYHYKAIPENKANGFDTYLELIQFFTFYNVNQHLAAYQFIDQLTRYEAKTYEYYPRMLGVFLLQHRQFERAGEAFKKSYLRGNISAGMYAGLAFSELPDHTKALEIWEDLTQKGDSITKKTARQMLSVLHPDSLPNLQIEKLSESTLYYYTHFQQSKIDSQKFQQILKKFTNKNLQAQLIIDRFSFLIRENRLEEANHLRQTYTIPQNLPKRLVNDFLFWDLRLAYQKANLKRLAEMINKASFEDVKSGYITLYQAVLSEKEPKKAVKLYQQALQELPFEEDVVIKLAKLYNQQNAPQEAYNILLKNLENYPNYRYYPPKLLQSYIVQCIQMGYDSYGEDGLDELEELIKPTDFQEFKSKIKSLQTELEKEFEDF